MAHDAPADPGTHRLHLPRRPRLDAAGVVLGFGTALDCEIRWDAAVLTSLAATYDVGPEDLAQQRPIRTERDLVVSILAFLSRSAGGERRVDEPAVVTEFCARFERRPSLGGTCVRAAAAMLRLGQQATVHLAFDDEQVRRLLPPGTQVLLPSEDQASYPHLVVQYPVGAQVVTDRLNLVATRANRLIYVNDPANELLLLSPDLPAAVAASEVFLISGLNAMRDVAQLRERLTTIEQAVRGRTTGGLVMYEDAGFHEPHLAAVVRNHMARLVDVYSLSDEELAEAVARPGDAADLDLHDAQAVLAAVSTLAERLGVPVVVVHSRHWALAHGSHAGRYAEALAVGVALATARYAHGELVTPEQVDAVTATPPDAATAAFVERLRDLAGGRVACAAVPTLQVDNPTTVGLGDTFVGGFLAACARMAPEPHAPAVPSRVLQGESP
jgi:ADP-dependent phosphofructokinase/glucokinase